MTWMLRLYPRGWRRRYGGEVAALVASEERSFRLFLDLLAGAIDARLNPQWTPGPSPPEGEDAMPRIRRLCAITGFSPAEKRRSGAWLIGSSLGFVLLGLALQFFLDKTVLGQTLIYGSFPMALILSSRSTYLKAYSPPVRWILLVGAVAGMFAFFLAVTYFAISL